MKKLKVKQVDVFTKTPLCGNPVAVVLEAQGLNAEVMQAIAREMNLSETTFVLPVCGTGNGTVAAYIAKHSLMPGERFEYLAEQGSEVLHPETVVVRAELGKNRNWSIQVGGQAVTVLVGEILL